MEATIARFAKPEYDHLDLWRELIARLRPARPHDTDKARENIRILTRSLRRNDELRDNLRTALVRLFVERKTVSLYVSSGLLPSVSFFSESARRLTDRLLPEVIDPSYMRGVLAILFNRKTDEIWVGNVPDADWLGLLDVLFDPNEAELEYRARDRVSSPLSEIIEALRMLSYHVSSIGLDPELVRIDPTLEEHESPFLAQNAELVDYLANYRAWWQDDDTHVEDEKQLLVMLDQCKEVVARIRRKATKLGTSLSLTLKLERLDQHLDRIASLLEVLTQLRTQRNINSIGPQIIRLFKHFVRAECRKNRLSDYWSENLDLLSRRMTESARKTGEKFITSTRSEYFGILRSAALGGFIIALMAAVKVMIGWFNMPPLIAGLAVCLNYGLGFALIHILGGTVATKQPAMTANALAASIGEAKGSKRDLENLVELITRTVRSQLGAILGNVGVAIPMAMLFAFVVYQLTGKHFVDEAQAFKLLGEIHPLSGALFYAGIAGACLFLSGLIAGYYDNLCAYGRIPQRILQLRWPYQVFGEARTQKIAAYIENNLGALAGNFLFGFLLGGVTTLGILFGLPLDIRHIAFSSAYWGHAMMGLEFDVSLQLAVWCFVGVLLIGLTNLAVSFALTLSVAMRSRRILFSQGSELVGLVLKKLVTQPRDFFLPPRSEPKRLAEKTPPPASEPSVKQ